MNPITNQKTYAIWKFTMMDLTGLFACLVWTLFSFKFGLFLFVVSLLIIIEISNTKLFYLIYIYVSKILSANSTTERDSK